MSRLRWTCVALLILAAPSACSRESSGSSADDARRRGDELASKGQYSAAAAAYQQVVDANPQDGKARFALAKAQEKAGHATAAMEEAIKAADLMPDDHAAQVNAISWMLKWSRYEDAAERSTALLQKDPNDVEVLLLNGSARARLTDPQKGLWFTEQTWRRGETADAARARMRPRVSREDDAAAEAKFRRAIELAPNQFDVIFGMTSYLWAVGRMDEGGEVLRRSLAISQDDPLANRALGFLAETKGRLAEAEHHLKVANSTGNHESRQALIYFYSRHGRAQDALALLESMTPAKGDDTAELQIAELEVMVDRRKEALARVERVLARVPGDPRALELKAALLLDAGDIANATAAARASIVADPNALGARLALARAIEKSGNREAAFSEYAALWRRDTRNGDVASEMAKLALALGRTDEALQLAGEALRLNPADRDAAITVTSARIRKGDLAAAERTLEPLLPGHGTDANLIVLQAAIQAGRGDTAAARASYLRALQSDRDSLEALTGLFDLESKAGKGAEVRPRISEAAGRHPQDPAYALLSARAARAAGDSKGAETALRTVLDKSPDQTDAARMLVEVLDAQNRREEAKAVLDRTLARQPDSTDLQLALAALLESMGRGPEARTIYEAIVAKDKKAWLAAVRLAGLYADRGENLEVAMDLAESAWRLAPKEPAAADAMGWLYVKRKLYSSSVPYLEDAVKGAPGNAEFHYHLGVAYEAIAEFPKARVALNKALALEPNASWALEARKVLTLMGGG